MTLFAMSVMCDCQHPQIIAMDPEGWFTSDHDEARCYGWICPSCLRRCCIRLSFPEEDE